MNFELLSRPEVERRVNLTTSTIYRLMRSGRFPLPLKVGPQAVRWRSDELSAWILSRPRAEGEIIPEAIPNKIEAGSQFAAA